MKPLIVVFLFIGFILLSCSNDHNQKTLTDLFNRTSYDTIVIQHMYLYDSLRKVLIQNLDTIFKYRDSRTPVYNRAGDSGYTDYEKHNFYIFVYRRDSTGEKSEDDIGPNTLPAYIYPTVKNIYETLGRKNIGGFQLWTDSTIEIHLRGFRDPFTQADVVPLLLWKRVVDISGETLMKDTLIAPQWTYEIGVFEKEIK